MPGPLHGIKILEIAGIGPGPFAAMLLADMGADILRVDRAAYLVGAGVLVLCASALLPWIEIPSSTASSVDTAGALLIEAPASWPELVWRTLFLVVGLALMASWLIATSAAHLAGDLSRRPPPAAPTVAPQGR